MSDIITILGSDQIRNSRQDINDNFETLNNDKLEVADAVTQFTQLSDVPPSYTDQAGRLVRVNDTEDGLEFVDPEEPTPTPPGGTNKQLQFNNNDEFGGADIEYTNLGGSLVLIPKTPTAPDTQGTHLNIYAGDGTDAAVGGSLGLHGGAKEGGSDSNRNRIYLQDDVTQILGGDAMSGSDDDGNDVVLSPGQGDGSGENGEVVINGQLNLVQTPVTETITPDKTITISLDGTLYKIPVEIAD